MAAHQTPRPWDSPGKNTGVGCHFLLQGMKVKSESEVAQLCPTLSDPMDCSHQAPLSMGFSRQEYWSGMPFPSPGKWKEESSNSYSTQWVEQIHFGHCEIYSNGKEIPAPPHNIECINKFTLDNYGKDQEIFFSSSE